MPRKLLETKKEAASAKLREFGGRSRIRSKGWNPFSKQKYEESAKGAAAGQPAGFGAARFPEKGSFASRFATALKATSKDNNSSRSSRCCGKVENLGSHLVFKS
jgi:hypothetical protein